MIRATTIAACILAVTATGAVGQSMTPNLSSTHIVDEYGRHYNERGDEISRPGMGGKRFIAQRNTSWRDNVPAGRAQAVMGPRTQAMMGPRIRPDIPCGPGPSSIVDEYGRNYNQRGEQLCR